MPRLKRRLGSRFFRRLLIVEGGFTDAVPDTFERIDAEMRVAAEDERLDAERLVGVQLGHHLVGVAHDGRAAAAAGSADAGLALDEVLA